MVDLRFSGWSRFKANHKLQSSDRTILCKTIPPPKAFTGRKWKPEQTASFDERNVAVQRALSAMAGQDDASTPYPRYDHCANCTKKMPNMNRCSQCKMVNYCSRDCQSSHWKKVHKSSCTKAQPLSLYKCMNGNDGFFISPDECRALQNALSKDEKTRTDDVIRCFRAYFDVAGDLHGCFML